MNVKLSKQEEDEFLTSPSMVLADRHFQIFTQEL